MPFIVCHTPFESTAVTLSKDVREMVFAHYLASGVMRADNVLDRDDAEKRAKETAATDNGVIPLFEAHLARLLEISKAHVPGLEGVESAYLQYYPEYRPLGADGNVDVSKSAGGHVYLKAEPQNLGVQIFDTKVAGVSPGIQEDELDTKISRRTINLPPEAYAILDELRDKAPPRHVLRFTATYVPYRN